jgi:hypothetical protein
MKVGLPNSTRQNQARQNQSSAGFNLPLPTNQAVYSNLAGAGVDWDMIEADLGARLDWHGVVEVQAPTGLARGFYLNSKFSTGIVSSGGEITPCNTQTMRGMALQHGARLNIFALSANLVRLSIASSDWQIQREGLAKEDFHAWAAELEANRGSGALEVSVLSGRRGILAFEFGVRTLTVFQALTSLSFDETALEWLNALAGRPDARVRWFGGADSAAFTGLETMELPPISVGARPMAKPVSVQAPSFAPPEASDEDDMDLLELSDDIRLSKDSGTVSSEPDLQPVAQPINPPVVQPVVLTAPQIFVQPVVVQPIVRPVAVQPDVQPVVQPVVVQQVVRPVAEFATAPVASVPAVVIPVPRVIEQPLEVTWPMVIAAWSDLLAFTERRTDAARGSETFDRTWRESCIALAERYPVLDPFFADVKYAAGILSVRAQTPSLIEALVAAYQHSLVRLGIPLGALEPLVQPIRARHEAVWAAAGLEVLWRR